MDIKLSEQQWLNLFADEQAGIYLIDKAKGDNSFRAVSVLRKLLNIKKVGFAGTLDPLATGLLILASGKATRMLDWFHVLPKTYQADIKFGITSPTYDLEGELTINKSARKFSLLELEKQLKYFLGEQEQIVPIFSAKKINGKRLYKLARQGKKITLPKSKVEIYKLKILKFSYPNLKLEIKSSAGTYVRSLVHDLGQALSAGAVLTDLRRVAIGDFLVSQAISLEGLNKANLIKNKIKPEFVKNYLDQYLDQ